MVTLAPEVPGAIDLTRQLINRGVVVSAGHSAADFESSQATVEPDSELGREAGEDSQVADGLVERQNLPLWNDS